MTSEQIKEYLKEYANQGFSQPQIDEIEFGMQDGLDVSLYAKKELNALIMYQLRRGMMEDLDVTPYASSDYDWFQVAEIIEGLKLGLDVKKYDSADIDAKKMKEIRLGLENGVDLSYYKAYDSTIIHEVRTAHAEGIDISLYVIAGYDNEQLQEIRDAISEGLDIYGYLDNSFSSSAIKEIAKGVRDGVNVELYAKKCYTWLQMREIRHGLRNDVDVSLYSSPLYDRFQMEQIRLGLEEGLPVDEYTSFIYPASVMEKIRNGLATHTIDAESGDGEDVEVSVDGVNFRLEVSVSNDDMSAYLMFPKELFGKVNRKDILRALKRESVTQNIDARMMDDLLSGKHLGELVTIATGKSPIAGEDGHYEFFFNTKVDKTPTVLPDGSVDFQNVDWFEHVKRGQKLAYYHSPGKGEPGHTVTGKKLKPDRGKELKKLKGNGFYIDADKKTYISEYDGRVDFNGEYLNVSKDLTVGSVNQSSGNVRFEGNIVVNGDVSDGAIIEAGGNVIVEGFVENAKITAGGDIILKKGANGGVNTGTIIAGGNLEGKFIENMTVEARGDIIINYALNSKIHTEGFLTVSGNKSQILGGEIFAARGIRAGNVGNESGMKTRIRMGVSDNMLSSQRGIDDHLKDLDGKLQVLYKGKQNILDKYSEEERKELDLYDKIENAIYTLEMEKDEYNEKRRNVLKDIAATADAMLTIPGNLYENIFIDINGKKIISTQTRNVTVKLTENRVAICKNF